MHEKLQTNGKSIITYRMKHDQVGGMVKTGSGKFTRTSTEFSNYDNEKTQNVAGLH